jgi:hypothetical protein
VIVFNATTGAHKRHWAYGAVPSDDKVAAYKPGAEPSKQFGNPHCVRRTRRVGTCDRPNNRIQVFLRRHLRARIFIDPPTLSGPSPTS